MLRLSAIGASSMHKVLDRQPSGQDQQPSSAHLRKRGRAFLWIVVLGSLLAGFAWWLQSAPTSAPHTRGSGDAASVVRLDEVKTGEMPVTLEALGTVTALSTVTVKTQISGNLTEVGFQEGQSVKKGDFLVQIDPRPYQAALDQAQGQLARDQALLAAANVDLARYEKLLKQDSIASQTVDTQRALVRQDEAIVRSDQANVETASLNLKYCHIISPIDGRVGLRLVDPGNYVQPSDANGIVVIAQTQPMSVIFTLAQDTIPQFIKKLRSGEHLPVLAYDRSDTTQLATGTLTTIDNEIDTSTGTVKLRATFPNTDESLFPNQFVNIKLIVDTLRNATIAPSSSVQIGAPGPYVYIANSDNTVSVRAVKLGPSDTGHAVILKGLAAGDNVVVDGIDRLRDGAKIRLSGSPRSDANDTRNKAGGHDQRHDSPSPSK